MKTLKNEKGMILLTVLMLMFIGTLLGIIALNNSTVEVQIAGNEKLVSRAFATCEAGSNISIPIIERSIASGKLDPSEISIDGNSVIFGADLWNEINDPAYSYNTDSIASSPDLSMEIGQMRIKVDIDRLFQDVLPGGAIAFAMGYEGIGKGAAGGGTVIYYIISCASDKL